MSHLDLYKEYTKDFLKFIILDLLNEKAQQGFTLASEIHMRYTILVRPNTIYRLFDDMIDDGLIESKGKNYYITNKGRDALKSSTKELEKLNLTFEGENLVDK
ncbi:MAG: PadR family transcriptional regulator [archaeon]|nr:PadR family transcriptional regulator [archaeon]